MLQVEYHVGSQPIRLNVELPIYDGQLPTQVDLHNTIMAAAPVEYFERQQALEQTKSLLLTHLVGVTGSGFKTPQRPERLPVPLEETIV